MTPVFKALVILALLLSGIAVFYTGNSSDQDSRPPLQKVEQVNTQEIEKTLKQLQAELITISSRLDALETSPGLGEAPESNKKSGVSKDALVGEAVIAARVEEAVEKALDQQGVDLVKKAQRQAKRESTLSGFDKYVTNYGEGLPQVYQSIAEKMNLDRNRQQQLEETLEAGWTRMDELTTQLFNGDLPPDEEFTLMGEIKSVGGETIQELGTFLNGGEMLQLGEIMMATDGTQRMGMGIAGAGKDAVAEEDQTDGSQ